MSEPTVSHRLTPLAADDAVSPPTELVEKSLALPGAPVDSSDITGRTIGEYEIMSRIGGGGMGAVYKGRHPLIGKRVAVKVLLPQHTSDESSAARFLSEARAVNAAQHRGIVDIFSFGQLPNGAHYFVMEYLEGEGFDQLIKDRAPIVVGEALLWTSEVLEALEAAHRVRIIHRDIKPSNLFLVSNGHSRPYVKVLDFGVAKATLLSSDGQATRASLVVGTPEYMSPEQVLGLPVSPATDLYGLGCVLYELLTGRRLFYGDNPTRTMWMHAESPPPRAATLNARVPQAVDDLLQWMLRKNASERPQSAEELRQHVERLLLELPDELAPEASVAFAGRPSPSVRLRPSGSKPPPLPGPVPTFDQLLSPTQTVGGPRPQRRPWLSNGLGWRGIVTVVATAVALGAVLMLGRSPSSDSRPTPLVIREASAPLQAPAQQVPEPSPTLAPVAEAAALTVRAAPARHLRAVSKVPSRARLELSLSEFEAALVARETKFGEADRVLRPLLAHARVAVERADTEAQRREAATFLEELGGQLKPLASP